MNEAPVIERIEFAVYSDMPVPGWPPDVRRLLRVGSGAFHDLDKQEMSPDERSFVIEEQPVDAAKFAVSVNPYPRLVAKPEGA